MNHQKTMNRHSLDGDAAKLQSIKIEGLTVPRVSNDHHYPDQFKRFVMILALCLAVFCLGLDNAIIVVAIPKITNQFSSLGDIGWYGSGYFLTTCSFQLLYGKLYATFSIKNVFLGAVLIFEIGSVVCGAAPSSIVLIIGRAIAGVGAAGLYSGAAMIINWMVPLAQRPTYIGLIGTMMGFSSVAGPILGGAFTDKVTWRWCFYINLPFGLITAGIIICFFDSPRLVTEKDLSLWAKLRSLDLLGSALFIPGVICLLIALQKGGIYYPWHNWRFIILIIISLSLILVFIIVQWHKGESATIPPRLMAKSDVWAAFWFSFCLGGCFFVGITYLPIWFQAVQGKTAVGAGLHILPTLIAYVLSALVAGIGITVFGYYNPFLILATIIMAVGSGFMTRLHPSAGPKQWIGFQVLFGTGTGLGLQLPIIIMQTVLQGKDVAIGTAVQVFASNLGGTLFITIGQTIFENLLTRDLQRSFPQIPQIKEQLKHSGATDMTLHILEIEPSGRDKVLQAYNISLTKVFYISAACGAASILGTAFVKWTNVKKQQELQQGQVEEDQARV